MPDHTPSYEDWGVCNTENVMIISIIFPTKEAAEAYMKGFAYPANYKAMRLDIPKALTTYNEQ